MRKPTYSWGEHGLLAAFLGVGRYELAPFGSALPSLDIRP
jgi:hypothetical protein